MVPIRKMHVFNHVRVAQNLQCNRRTSNWMKLTLRVNPEQAAYIANTNDIEVVASEGDTYGNLKHHLCAFCEQLPGYIGEPHILFEKNENGAWRRLFNALEVKEDYKENDIVYWKCISPEFLSQTQISSKRKAADELPPISEAKKNKTNEDIEYEKKRTDFLQRLGENVESKKIIPINTASVWSVIKIEHNKELGQRYIVLPREKIKILTLYLQRVKIGTKIAKNLSLRNSEIVHIPIPAGITRSDADLLSDLEQAQVMQYNYEVWHESLSSISVTGINGTSYPVVWPVTCIPLSKSHIDSLMSSYNTKKSSSELNALIQLVNETIKEEYGQHERHNLVTFFPRLSTVSPRDVLETKQDQKGKGKVLQIKNGEELVSLFLKSERIYDSLEVFSRFNDPEKKINLFLVEWQDIEKRGEFRCFIYKERLTAISQYFCYTNFPFTENDKKPIIEAIVNLWNQASLYIPYQNCVMDVYVDLSLDERLASIIEFNPFGGDLTSGSALYNWETDKQILYAEDDMMLGGDPDLRLLTVDLEPFGMEKDELSGSEVEESKSDDDLADDLKVFKSKKYFK